MLGLGLGTSKGGFVDALAELTNTKSIIFDGTNDHIAGTLTLSGDRSFAFWIKSTATTGNMRIFHCETDSSEFINISMNAGEINMYDGTNNPETSSEYNDGIWHHVVITCATNNWNIYVDGALVLNHTTWINREASSDSFTIGGGTGANNFEGNLDEIAIWDDILTANEITKIYNNNRANLDLSTNTGSYSSSANLKMWLRMGDEASTRVVDDNANNLVIPDMRKTFFTGKSIDFDGSDDYVNLSSPTELDNIWSSGGSISCWIKPNSVSDNERILDKKPVGFDGWFISLDNVSGSNCKLFFRVDWAGTNYQVRTTNTDIVIGSWNHIVITYNSDTFSNTAIIYVNGVAEGLTAGTQPTSGNSVNSDASNILTIGTQLNSGSPINMFHGQICDVSFYNTVLDANTITSIYNSGEPNNLLLPASYTAGSGVDKTANLQAYYRMGNGSIDAFSNSSQTGIGLIADYTNATLGTALVPNLSDDGNGNGSNWTLTTLAEWTINTNTATAFEATTDSDIDGTADAKLYVKTSNSGLSADIPAGVYKITGTLSTTSTLPSSNCRFVWYGGYATNIHNLSAGNFEIYELCTSSSTNHHFQFQTSTEGHNFKLENVKFEPVNGNAGITINTSAFDIVDHAPNSNSGDMINFDATADIETDTPTQIYTVANTKSVLFDGTDDLINFGDIELNGLSGLTVSAWFKANSTGASSRIVSKDQLGVQGCFILWIDGSNDLLFQAHNGTGFKIATYASFSEDTNWHHVAGVFSATAIKLYLDGAEVASATYPSSTLDDSDNEEVVIGADSDVASPDQLFKGNIDEVAIWNEALTASEVAQIYHGSQANFDLSQNGGGYTSASNLQAWWRMGDGTIDDFTLIGDQTDTSLQSNIIDSTKFFREEDGTSGGWTKYGSNSLSITSDSVTIANDSHTYGAKLVFKQTGANSSLTENLVVDQVYKFSCTISSLTDNNSNMKLNVTGASETSEVLSNGDAVIYFRASHATSNTFRLNGLNTGDTVTISNPSLQKVNGNAGIMKNMASSAIETDTP